MDRRARFIFAQIKSAGLPICSLSDSSVRVTDFQASQEVEQLVRSLASAESRLLQMNASFDALQKQYSSLKQRKQVVLETTAFFASNRQSIDQGHRASIEVDRAPLLYEADIEAQPTGDARQMDFDLE